MKKTLVLLLSLCLWISCKDSSIQLSKISAETKSVDTLYQQDSTVIKEFLPFKKKMVEEINRKLSYAPKLITRTDGELQSSLGNLMADLMYEKANESYLKTYQPEFSVRSNISRICHQADSMATFIESDQWKRNEQVFQKTSSSNVSCKTSSGNKCSKRI